MPIVNSRFFNDPMIGQAFANLAGMFGPPNAQDTLAFTTARAKREEAQRLAELFDLSKSPNFDQTKFDRMGVGAGAWSPSQSFYSVDQGNATTRYGYDTQAATSRANNAADNARALQMNAADNDRTLQTNAADNRRAMAQTALTTQSGLVGTMFGPVGQNQVRPALPGTIAGMFGLPEIPEARGPVIAGQGDTITLPDGRTLTGAQKPMSEDEVLGLILGRQPATAQDAILANRNAVKLGEGDVAVLPSGQRLSGAPKLPTSDELAAQIVAGMPPQDQRAFALKGMPVEQVMGPDGASVFMYRADAIGRAPAPTAAPKAPTELAQLQAERAGIAAADPRDPRIREYDARIGALGRGAAQDEYSKALDKQLAERNVGIQDNAAKARSKLATLDAIERLLSDPAIDTGAGAGLRLQLRRAASALGLDVGDVGAAEALNAISNQFALELRDPTGGAGMPGALSDSDRVFLQSMAPRLTASPEGNRLILDYVRRMAQRTVEVERLRQAYVADRGRLDDGFAALVGDYAASHPLFPEAASFVGAAPEARGSGYPAAPTAAGRPPASGYPDGTVIENDAGDRMIRRGGRWETFNGR